MGKAKLAAFDQIIVPHMTMKYHSSSLYFLYVDICYSLFSFTNIKAHFEMRSVSTERNKMEFTAMYSVCL